jgi:catechol 2,3-dioxygenase-like lactoylglutathione lyase family enzyme
MPADDFGFCRAVPILRIFSIEKAKEFYCGFLGFKVDWEHRFGDDFPLYMQVSRAGLVLHLSEHHGDACPGAAVHVETTGIDALHRAITAKPYRYYKPGIERAEWGTRIMSITDPFGNRLSFSEPEKTAGEKA